MSLLGFLEMPEVLAKIKPLRPKMSRKIEALLKVEPQTDHFGMVGTAFDYLLRFELQRRAPHAVSERWIAEYAPDILWRDLGNGARGGLDVLADADPACYLPPEEVSRAARKILEEAKHEYAAYLKIKKPSDQQQASLAAHTIRLAKLDEVFRVLKLDPHFKEAAEEDIADLVSLLRIVPFDSLIDNKLMLLNPNFGETSRLVGGSDTDLITGSTIIDFKTTKNGEMNARNLDQLFGYFLLARHRRRMSPAFPEINRLGLYFSRHGYLWVVDHTVWLQNPLFPEVEEWFFRKALEVFPTSKKK